MKSSVAFLNSLILFAPLLAENPDPKSLQFTKWTPDFQVPDPVAISFDEKGRAYVTQTQRRKANDLDIRNNRDWISNDLSFQSADDKRAFYRKNFTPENSSENQKRVKDFNKDGKHDLLDLQALSERIHLIEDTDGDGFADQSSLYAEGFHDEIAGIAAGVLHHDGDVYTTIVPDLWKLRDTDDDGKADTREAIATGFGVHLAYAGHDMHGLTVGPDGRIYWTIGDKGVSVKSKEGRHYKYPNQGAVLRCDPDGSNFEVYARGLRNVQELAFDQFGNLFGIDNDSDRPGEKERFIYIVQHMDAGWRSNWQYRGKDFNPWMDENLSVPWQKNQPAYILPPISLYENGPAGLAFNPGTALGEEWQNYFFHTSAPNGQQWSFQVEQNGASYKMVNDLQIGNGVPIVGINFGPDGTLYGVDWGGGYPLNQKGAIWKWDVKKKHPLREETARLLREGFSKTKNDELIAKLNHADQRVRLNAQFEMVKRRDRQNLKQASKVGSQLGRIHAIWGLGQLFRNTKSIHGGDLDILFTDSDPEIRSQAAKVYGEIMVSILALHRTSEPVPELNFLSSKLVPLLNDPSDRVKFQAAISLGNMGETDAAKPILEMLREVRDPAKTYLRHAAIVGLTGCASTEFLSSLASKGNFYEPYQIQAAAVVALRRRGDPAVALFLDSVLAEIQAEAARAIHDDWMIPEALPALSESLVSSTAILNESLTLRSINANFHLGTQLHAERVARLAVEQISDVDFPDNSFIDLRLDALDALSQWSHPPQLDRVTGRYRPLPKRDPSIVKNALLNHLSSLLTDPDSRIQTKALALTRSLNIKIPVKTLIAITENKNSLNELQIEALRALASQKYPSLVETLKLALQSGNAPLRIEALKLLASTDPASTLQFAHTLLSNEKGHLHEQQAAISLLANQLASDESDHLLSQLISRFENTNPALHLDLLQAAAARNLKAPTPDFTHTLHGGDAAKGKDLFVNHLAAQCIRCHKVSDGKGSDIGPNLKAIGSKKRTHLLQSLIAPQDEISQGYGVTAITLKNGKTIAGTFQKEENGVVTLKDAEGKITKIKTAEIKDRSPVISTMPPMGAILSKREIRDLIEYLATLKPNK